MRGDRYPASLLVRVKVEGPEVTTTSEAILNEGAATAVAEGGGSVAIETGASSETVMAGESHVMTNWGGIIRQHMRSCEHGIG